MGEFSIIDRYFRPLTEGADAAAALKDDAAVLGIPSGHELVVTSDTLNEGIHFLKGSQPEYIAKKVLRVNLSDLASMGAVPLCYQLNIAFPQRPEEAWLSSFSGSLLEDNQKYGVFCSGGDTTSIQGDCLSVSVTAMGLVPQGRAVHRHGAKDGDLLILTDSVGDAVLGLKLLQGKKDISKYPLSSLRYNVPEPRVNIDCILREYVHAAADISDGVLADSMHIAEASGLGLEVDLDKVIFSKEVQHAIQSGVIDFSEALKGGDDYELALAVTPQNERHVISALKEAGLCPMVIGVFKEDVHGISLINARGRISTGFTFGWTHF
ncbi:MAG: thiamine-phosphate kinase [Alphaproteobacteria bacterium]